MAISKQFHWWEDLTELRVFGKPCAAKIVAGLVDAGFFAGYRVLTPAKGSHPAVCAVHFDGGREASRLADELQTKFERDPYVN